MVVPRIGTVVLVARDGWKLVFVARLRVLLRMLLGRLLRRCRGSAALL